MPRTLPSNPNVEHLRKEAKTLLRSFKKGDTSVCDILRYHYRFARASDENILKFEVSLQEIQHALALDYGFKSWSELTAHIHSTAQSPLPSHDDTGSAADNLVIGLMQNAHLARASDLHLEWTNDRLVVRYRVDGCLRDVQEDIPDGLQIEIIPSLKRMANIDTGTGQAQKTGRLVIHVGDTELDVRVSVIPYVGGESAVLRFVDKGEGMVRLEQVGLTVNNSAILRSWEQRTDGLFLISGPTGSGKMTTLYSVLNDMNSEERKIVTCEDPVEYILEGFSQHQVDPSRGITFSTAVSELLSQDPDVIMIGEIRDLETLNLSVQLTLKGHLVCSSLHSDDAAQGVRRMVDLGVEPFLLKSKLIGIAAQRLVRRICQDCREEYMPESLPDRYADDLQGLKLTRGRGCEKCSNTGYRGRTAIHELLQMDDRLRNIVASGCDVEELRRQAVVSGMIPMVEDGLEKVRQGITTLEEVLRVTLDMPS